MFLQSLGQLLVARVAAMRCPDLQSSTDRAHPVTQMQAGAGSCIASGKCASYSDQQLSSEVT